MKERDELLLHLRDQVDQQVAAAQDVQLGKGRIHDEILGCEDHHLPDLLAHAVAMILLDEEPGQPLRQHVGGDVEREEALARFVNGVPVQVGGEDLQSQVALGLHIIQGLLERHGQGVGFLPARAPGHPRPQRMARGPAGQERRNRVLAQVLPGGGIPKEARHAEQQLLEEQIQLLRIGLQVADVGGHLADLVDAHAALDPPVKRVTLVKGEVVAGLGPQQDDRLLHHALSLIAQERLLGLVQERHVLQEGQDLRRQILHRGHDVRQPGVHRAARHAVELRRRRILHQRQPCLLLDGPQPQGAIRAHAGENHADAPVLQIPRQRAQEEFNRQPQPPRRRWCSPKTS